MGKSSRSARKPSMADLADRHALYEESVQCAEAEVDFVDETFTALRGRKARVLREDFCGTANVCCEWVRRRTTCRAIGVDIDAEVLDWGRAHNLSRLGAGPRRRVTLHCADVMKVKAEPAEILLAMNFSYWYFKDRKTLRKYFKRAFDALADDGIMFLDAFGGYESTREMKETTQFDGFTYVWDQNTFNAATGDYTCQIHFRFPDGSRLSPAFTYQWRFWTLPEIRELLIEAGFAKVTFYFQGWEHETGEPDGIFKAADTVEADAGWLAYITAEKPA